MSKAKSNAKSLKTLEKILGHKFLEPSLVSDALTHPSLEGEKNYQRLEFLGDRVLGLVIAATLYQQFPADSEGQLSRRFAALVRKETLSRVVGDLKIQNLIRMTETMEKSGGRDNPSVRSDALEALIGALFVDGGYKAAKKFIETAWQGYFKTSAAPRDAKSGLQEWAQGRGKPLPVYEIVERGGPDHAPSFKIKVSVEGLGAATAKGASKRVAETRAAEKLLAQGKKAK